MGLFNGIGSAVRNKMQGNNAKGKMTASNTNNNPAAQQGNQDLINNLPADMKSEFMAADEKKKEYMLGIMQEALAQVQQQLHTEYTNQSRQIMFRRDMSAEQKQQAVARLGEALQQKKPKLYNEQVSRVYQKAKIQRNIAIQTQKAMVETNEYMSTLDMNFLNQMCVEQARQFVYIAGKGVEDPMSKLPETLYMNVWRKYHWEAIRAVSNWWAATWKNEILRSEAQNAFNMLVMSKNMKAMEHSSYGEYNMSAPDFRNNEIDRCVSLRVMGTYGRPVVTVKKLEQLPESGVLRHSCIYTGVIGLNKEVFASDDGARQYASYYYCPLCGKLYLYKGFDSDY